MVRQFVVLIGVKIALAFILFVFVAIVIALERAKARR
jgi:hypothetical protein